MSDRSGPKIGILVPFTNTNLEPDMIALCPDGCTMHFARLGGYDADEIPGSSQMAGLGASDISDALRLISGVRPAVVLYGCTSATLTHGVSFDRSLAEQIARLSGARTFTAASAVVAAVKALGVTRIGFASPYLGEINDLAVKFLQTAGIEVASRADIGRELGNYGQGELLPEQVIALGMEADSDEAEALVLSCTDMRSVEVIEQLEDRTGKPVVTSNQAMAYMIYMALGMTGRHGLPGRLLTGLGQ